MQKALLSDSKKGRIFIKFNVEGLLRGDYASRMQGYSVGIQNGFLCPNDVRTLEDMDLIPAEEGGYKFMVNGSMTPLASAGAAYDLETDTKEEKDE